MINPFYALELNFVGEPHTKIALLAGFLPNWFPHIWGKLFREGGI